MKTLIIYASTHHGSAKKIAAAMAKSVGADLADAVQGGIPNIGTYDLIGLVSGIYFHSFHESIQKIVREGAFRPGQKVFLADTCGVAYRDYTKGLGKQLEQRGLAVLGSFQCRGYDTYGVFGKLGGIAKGHPDANDLERAEQFVRQMLDKAAK